MALKNHFGSAHRLRLVALSTSLGLLGTVATAQDFDIGDAIRSGIGGRADVGQRGTLDPTERGVGEAVRGVLQGDNAGDALRRGVGEAARTAGETPRQTLRRDRIESQQAQGRFRYDAQGRQMFDAQGRPLYDNRGLQYDNRGLQYDSRVQQYGSANTGIGVDAQTRSRARLGISMAQADQGIRVQQVMQGTAAAQAGLRPGDVIVSVAGQQISDPNQLSTLIRQRAPGDQLDLIVMRNGQRQTLSATLTGVDAGDRQRMARPILDDGSNQDLRQQLQQLQEEVQMLRNELNELRGTQDPAAADADAAARVESDARAAADQDADADAAAARADAALDLDADADADASAPDAPAPPTPDSAEADAAAGAELDADLDAAGAEAEADLGAELEGAASQQ